MNVDETCPNCKGRRQTYVGGLLIQPGGNRLTNGCILACEGAKLLGPWKLGEANGLPITLETRCTLPVHTVFEPRRCLNRKDYYKLSFEGIFPQEVPVILCCACYTDAKYIGTRIEETQRYVDPIILPCPMTSRYVTRCECGIPKPEQADCLFAKTGCFLRNAQEFIQVYCQLDASKNDELKARLNEVRNDLVAKSTLPSVFLTFYLIKSFLKKNIGKDYKKRFSNLQWRPCGASFVRSRIRTRAEHLTKAARD